MRARIPRRWPLAAVVLLAALILAIPTLALSGSSFESRDGNLVVNTAGNKDWQNAPNLARGNDLPTGQSDDSFGQGTKEDDPVPTVTDGSIPNNKSDLLRFYVSNETVGSTPFLYLAWVRANTLGTANMDFEFNKTRTLSSNGKTPVRSAGDVLITFDFASSGNQLHLGLHRWVASGDASLCEAANSTPCWGKVHDLNSSGAADGSVNDGFSVSDPIAGLTVPTQAFGEAAIDLAKALELGGGQCEAFGSAHLNSRSSDSFTSAVKDFIAPINVDINLCRPATVKVHKVDTSGNPLGGAVFDLSKSDGTKLGTCTTNSSGDCSFAPLTGSGTINLVLHEVTPPNGYLPAPDQSFSVTFTTTDQTITRTFTDTPVPGKIVIRKRDDAGNALAGAAFKVVRDAAPQGGAPGSEDTSVVGTCTTGSTGECTVANVPLGRSWVIETSAPAGYDGAGPQNVTIGLGPSPGVGQTVTLTFVDPRQHKIIVIVCHQGTNTLHPSSVTVDGETKTSLGTAPSGLTQAQLCGLGGAAYTGKRHGTHPASIAIPGH